ncbi:MAG: redoxin domain-containing protein [Prevotella sp.]|nr:redoxin domain-containing protein [Prevotella sp.]
MKKIIIKTMTMAIAAIALVSCGNGRFKVQGVITEAQDSVVFLENMALDGPQKVDSARLSADGEFSFSCDAPKDAPEFYRLRIAQQIINFSVDSIETLTVKASYPTMMSDYEIEGGKSNDVIKQLSLMQQQLQLQARQIVNAPDLGIRAVEDSVLRVVKDYKQKVMRDYIYKDPKAASSYFALFQGIVVGNSYMMVFDPRREVEDVKPFSAVATSWDTYYPNSLRCQNLHNIAIEAMKTKRILQASEEGITVDASKVTEATLIDIVLNDNKGVKRSLTELKGKVVLLDFHAFSLDGSQGRILALRELYNKYHDRGLEIYQVSLDEDEHFWKMQTAALPWVSVRDTKGASNAYLYQAEGLPLDYIINRDNQVVLGPRQIKDLEADIARYL